MELYLFETSAEFLTLAPTDQDGVPVGDGDGERPLDEVRTVFVQAMYSEPVIKLPDRLSVGVKRYIVLRTKLADVLVADFRMPIDLSITPVIVLSKNGKRQLSDEFVLLHSREEYDILDRGNSEYIAVHRGEHIEVVVSVTKWSVCRDAVPPLDMFIAVPNDLIVSREVKDWLGRCGSTGLKLTKVNVV